MVQNTLQLNRREVESIIGYVFYHVRATSGTARETYDKMQAFLDADDRQPELFAVKRMKDTDVP